MAFSFLYLAGRAQLGALIRSRRGPDVKDVELLVLRHITLFVRVSDGLAPRAERHAMNGMSSGAIVTNGRIMSRSPRRRVSAAEAPVEEVGVPLHVGELVPAQAPVS
jgi:hypothetical protein